jgi:elongation factor Ts
MQISASMVKELRERTGAGMMECKKALVDTDGDIDLAVVNLRKAGQAKADKKAGRVAAEGVIVMDAAASGAAIVEVNCETDFVSKRADFQAFAALAAGRALAERVADAGALASLPAQSGSDETLEQRRRALVATIGENITLRRAAFVPRHGDHLGMYVHQGSRIGVVVDMAGGSEDLARDVAMHVAAVRPLALDEASLDPEVLAKEREILRAQVAGSGKPPEIQEKMLTGRIAKFLKENTLLGQPFVKDDDQTVSRLLSAAGAKVLGFTRYEVGEGIEKKAENFAAEVMAQVRDSEKEPG